MIAEFQERVGAYRLVERIAAGGMGEVYRAVHAHDGSPAAVKLLFAQDSLDREARHRLEREGEIVSHLHHVNVVRLLARGNHDGRLFLAMELLEGETLAARLRRGKLPPEEAVDAARQVLSALAELHSEGVIHRDVSPSNIFRCRNGRYVLLDFGLARGHLDREGAERPHVRGTLPYMAPEQLRGEEATERSDLWSFGVVLHEMITGKSPWNGASTLRMALGILSMETTLRPLPLEADSRLRAIAAAVLRPLAADRPANAGRVLAELSGYISARERSTRARAMD